MTGGRVEVGVWICGAGAGRDCTAGWRPAAPTVGLDGAAVGADVAAVFSGTCLAGALATGAAVAVVVAGASLAGAAAAGTRGVGSCRAGVGPEIGLFFTYDVTFPGGLAGALGTRGSNSSSFASSPACSCVSGLTSSTSATSSAKPSTPFSTAPETSSVNMLSSSSVASSCDDVAAPLNWLATSAPSR